jgi:hypothetical protein
MSITDGYTTLSVVRPQMGSTQRGTGRMRLQPIGMGKKQRGKGIFGDIAKALGGIGGGALGAMIGQPGIGSSIGSALGGGVGNLLGGRRKRRAKKQNGKGVMDILKKVRDLAKEHKLISRGIGAMGYGRKRRARK